MDVKGTELRSGKLLAGLLGIGLLGAVFQSQAQVVLHDANSTAIINPTSQAGMFHWDLNGVNQLQQQWFWYGIGAGPTFSIDTISAPTVTPKGANEAIISYANAGFSVTVDYVLTGGSPIPDINNHVNGDIGESIKIVNTTTNVLPFHFYQYSYFNINGANSDTVQLGQNLHGLFNEADQIGPFGSLSETVVTPGANHGEVAPLGATLAKLNGGGPVVLGPPFFSGPLGPGAVTWALQWDFLIGPGASAVISKDKYLDVQVIPEPSTIALVGVIAGGWILRRRQSKTA